MCRFLRENIPESMLQVASMGDPCIRKHLSTVTQKLPSELKKKIYKAHSLNFAVNIRIVKV